MAKCAICSSDQLQAVNQDLSDGMSGVEISAKYGFPQMTISRHKRHRQKDNLEDVRTLLNTAVDHEKIKITNAADYIRLLEYEQNLKDCDKCEFKLRQPQRRIEDVLKEFIGFETPDDIFITREENALFIEWLKTLPEDHKLRKEYKLYDLKIKGD